MLLLSLLLASTVTGFVVQTSKAPGGQMWFAESALDGGKTGLLV
jgi:hypothetical protein